MPRARTIRDVPALAPFRSRSFRFQWPADLLTSCAFEMELLILGWYVLVTTGSVTWLTVYGASQYPGTLLSPVFGLVGDRIGHRNVLCGMRLIYTVLSSTLLTLTLTGLITPPIVIAIAFINGLVRPSDLAMRGTLVAENIPPDQLMGAMGISRTTSDLSRIGGALTGASLFAALGMGRAYMFIVACYALGFLLTLGVATGSRRGHAIEEERRSPWRELVQVMVYVWSRPNMRAGMWLAMLVNMTAFPITSGLLPYVAQKVYHISQTGLGLLIASFAGGAFTGSLALTVLGQIRAPARTMLFSTLVWYVLLLAFVFTGTPILGGAFLYAAGFFQSWSMIPLAVMLLQGADASMRGRVMGARMMVIYGLPLGLLLASVLINAIGFRAMATCYIAVGFAATILLIVTWRDDAWQDSATDQA